MSMNPRMVQLYRHAFDWATNAGVSEEIAHSFAFYRTNHYWEWTESDWDSEESLPHPNVWRVWCQSEDRSEATGERYVIDYLSAVALADSFSRS